MKFDSDQIYNRVVESSPRLAEIRSAQAAATFVQLECDGLFRMFPFLEESYRLFLSRCAEVSEIDEEFASGARDSVNTKLSELIEDWQPLWVTLSEIMGEDAQFTNFGEAELLLRPHQLEARHSIPDRFPAHQSHSGSVEDMVEEIHWAHQFIEQATQELVGVLTQANASALEE